MIVILMVFTGSIRTKIKLSLHIFVTTPPPPPTPGFTEIDYVVSEMKHFDGLT
jgi:hypothetical protein